MKRLEQEKKLLLLDIENIKPKIKKAKDEFMETKKQLEEVKQ
ncbi:hypothetical protein [Candidatus Phytoplasma ziziphi]|nr:hypothetical protein [Candidatus Phytoplasma ziziphi]